MFNTMVMPEDIRLKALDILAGKKEGIKQAELFKKTESALLTNHIVPEHSIKNALWDISDRYSDFVIKKKASYREVWLYPTDELIAAAPLTQPSGLHFNSEEEAAAFDEVVAEMSRHTEDFKLKKSMLTARFMEAYRFIEFSDLLSIMAEVQLNYLNKLTPSEEETFFRMKFALKELREIRNEISHQGGLSKGK